MAKDKKGLGSGLGALFGDDILEDESELQYLPVQNIEPRADQPRSKFDESALRELAESIRRYGIIQPLTVRMIDDGYYQIIAGERRWRAARIAGLAEVPARIIKADDRMTAEMALVENLQREDLNPIEEALGYKTLIEQYGMTQDEAAKCVGRSRPAVTNALRLLSLSEAVRKLVENGELSAGHARALIPIQDGEMQLKTAKKIISEGLSVRKTEQLAAKAVKPKEEKPAEEPQGIVVNYVAETEDFLSRSLARKVNIEENKGKGKIILEYYNSDDREALIENLIRMSNSWEEIKGE